MKNKNKKIYGTILLLLFVLGGLIFWGLKSVPKIEAPVAEKMKEGENSGIIYYFAKGCSHCENVQKFLNEDENKMVQKIIYAKKEISADKENSKEFYEKISQCGLDETKAGVPLIFANGQCFVGDREVINFFKKEIGTMNQAEK